jgi:hypothetical protein
MSKKRGKKRKRKPNLPADAQRATTSVSKASSVVSKGGRGFNPDYSYVVKDLQRIGALAGSFIVILIVLSFFLR